MAKWLARWREVTVAIGRTYRAEVIDRNGKPHKTRVFLVVGTGVIVALRNDRTRPPWLVTAKHVFLDPADKWHPSELYIRFPWFEEREIDEYLGVRVDLRRRGKRLWVPHPNDDVDLACLPLVVTPKQSGRRQLPIVSPEDLGTVKGIYQGAPVIVLGYPGAVGPGLGPRAMVRQGMVSWVSSSRPTASVFLIDSHVFPGNSGGPAFAPSDAEGQSRGFVSGRNMACVGIVTQARIQKIPLTAGGKQVEVTFKGKKTPETLFAPSFMAIGVVEPVSRVRELLRVAERRSRYV